MDIKSFFNQKKNIYNRIINYLENGLSKKNDGENNDDDENNNDDSEDNNDENNNEVIFKNKDEFREFLIMLSKISKNHHRDSFFMNRIDAIISHFEDQIKQTFSNLELFKIFKKNFQLILLLSKKQILFFDESIYKYTLTKVNKSLYHFFYPEMKSFLSDTKQKQIENEILSYDSDAFQHFDEKRTIGENDSYICQLIRSDSIDDFIIYLNRNNIKCSSIINTSIYETNPFLLKNNKTSLIEYAAFYGSIQIFQYLRFSKAELSNKLWLYAIHGKNGELIHLLEENRIFPEYRSYYKCLQEAIKCHHNDIVNYINDKYISGKIINFEDNIFAYSFHYHNYKFMPNDLNEHVFISYYLCQYDYMSIFLNNKSSLFLAALKKKKEIVDGFLSKEGKIIAHHAYRNSKFDKITIASSVITIKRGAFLSSSLHEITFESPSSLIKISDFAFGGCESLVKISIPSSVKYINDYVFYQCYSLEEVTLPSSITEINNYVFNECKKLKKINISSSVKKIGYFAFLGCYSLTDLIIPSSVTELCQGCFAYCKSLTNVSFEEPCSIKYLSETFSGCSSLKKISIPTSVTNIRKTFDKCTSLTNVDIPSSVSEICYRSFRECISLTSIVIPSSVVLIEDDAFEACTSLTNVEILSTNIDIKKYAFFQCPAFQKKTNSNSNEELEEKNTNRKTDDKKCYIC